MLPFGPVPEKVQFRVKAIVKPFELPLPGPEIVPAPATSPVTVRVTADVEVRVPPVFTVTPAQVAEPVTVTVCPLAIII